MCTSSFDGSFWFCLCAALVVEWLNPLHQSDAAGVGTRQHGNGPGGAEHGRRRALLGAATLKCVTSS